MQLANRHNSLVDRRTGLMAGAIPGGDGAHRSVPAAPSCPGTGTRSRVSGDKWQATSGRRLVVPATLPSRRVPEPSVSEQPALFPETAGRLPAPLWAALVLNRTLCG
ncbi:MAG: hypothetical protein WD069_12450 [Planctomycetales bacterium]